MLLFYLYLTIASLPFQSHVHFSSISIPCGTSSVKLHICLSHLSSCGTRLTSFKSVFRLTEHVLEGFHLGCGILRLGPDVLNFHMSCPRTGILGKTFETAKTSKTFRFSIDMVTPVVN